MTSGAGALAACALLAISRDYRSVPRILVIDDEEMVRAAIALIIRSRGWTVEEAKDGLEGLTKARNNPPDAIVCDLNMPVMDGFQVIEAIRQDPALKTTPFIVITGQTAHRNEARALAQGADAVLLKPFSNSALIGVVQAHLEA
jgi:two-component system, sensor histidine kinase and response regulator